MSEALHVDMGGAEAPPRRGPGRPPKTPVEIKAAADAAFEEAAEAFNGPPMALVVISVKPSEGNRCPYVPDGEGGTRISTPKERIWIDLETALHMEQAEQAIILERKG